VTRKKNTTAHADAEARRARAESEARRCVLSMLKYRPLTVADEVEYERHEQKGDVMKICKALQEKEPWLARILMGRGLEAWLNWALGPSGGEKREVNFGEELIINTGVPRSPDSFCGLPKGRGRRKDNQIRDKTLADMVYAILYSTNLRPMRNQARQGTGHSACSIIVEVLREERNINLSEAVVENAWKTYLRAHPGVRAELSGRKRYREECARPSDKTPRKLPTLVYGAGTQRKTRLSEK
jgi:hypothetical protein